MKILKDSNVAWIGKIPSDWTLLRIKHTSWLKGRIGWDGLKSSEFTNEGPFLITGTDFTNGVVNWNTCVHITEERFNEDMLLHVKEGDLLITKDGTVGKVAIVNNCPEKVSLNSGIMIIRNITKFKYEDKFLYYVLMSNVFTEWFNYNTKPGTTILHLYQGDFYNFRFMLPNLTEQQQIVSYLDAKCDAIDKVIAHKRSVIEKLKEYRTAVITKTVTKGLNPDVEMKDSGNDFFGKIPCHWKLYRLKYFYDYKNGSPVRVGPFGSALKTADFVSEGIWVYNQRTVLDNDFENSDTFITKEKYETLLGFTVYPKDILITSRGTLGKITSVPDNAPIGILHPCLIRFRIKDSLLSFKLLKYIFNDSNIVKNQIFYKSEGTTIEALYSYNLKNLVIPKIPISEQQQIIDYLDAKCSKIDTAIQQQEQAITKLEEYRKSVIYYAVTGKIDCGKAV